MAEKVTFSFDEMLSSAREAYGEELYRMAKEGKDFVFTYSDNVAPSSSAGRLIKEFPDRCFNVGIAEPDQVGISAGLALSGQTVFAQVFGPFLPLRAADQIHTDIAYNDVNVRLIGTHSGVTSGGGPTHNVIADIAFYRAVPNLTILSPADAGVCCKFIRQSMDYNGPVIIRIDRAGSPVVYDDSVEVTIGKAIEAIEGSDAYIISTGSFVYRAVKASEKLAEEGLKIGVLDMSTIKPLDVDAIKRAADKCGTIVTLEDHSINGGLGGAVAEVLCEYGFGGKFKRIGLPDKFSVLGDTDEVYKYYGLDIDSVAQSVKELLSK